MLSLFPLAASAEYTFLALGDWGGDSDDAPTSPTQLETEKGLAAVAEQLDSQFFFGLGDNFYTSGLNANNVNTRIKATWEDVYTDASLQKEWWMISGNHDHRGEIQYQIDYDGTGNWHYPAEYYTFKKTTPEGKVAQFVVFDSITVAGESYYDKLTDTFHKSPGPKNLEASYSQIQWLEGQLSQSTADFLFTVSHYPFLSPCDHGPQMEWMRELVARYSVTAHLAGHDHCLAHSTYEGVHHVLSGAGADNWYGSTSFAKYPEGADVQWLISKDNHGSHIGGFVAVTLDANAARFRYYNEKAELLYTSDPAPARVYTPSNRTTTTATTTTTTTATWVPDHSPCNESAWPDKDHGLICGTCKVLVNHFDSVYHTCGGYCKAVSRYCVDAWEEADDTCAVDPLYEMNCETALASSDAICQCSGAGTMKCSVCAHIYDPKKDCGGKNAPSQDCGTGVAFEDLPSDWKCPVCGQGKDKYHPADGADSGISMV